MTNGEGRFKKILVPVDGSKFSFAAVKISTRMAKIHGSQIFLLHVIDEAILEQLSRYGEKSKNDFLEEMKKGAKVFQRDMAKVIKAEGIPVTVALSRGAPHEAILREARHLEADLIVMGKLGKRGVSKILLGSVAERVIEFSTLPVLVING